MPFKGQHKVSKVCGLESDDTTTDCSLDSASLYTYEQLLSLFTITDCHKSLSFYCLCSDPEVYSSHPCLFIIPQMCKDVLQ